MIDLILKDFKLKDEDVLNVYMYGSHVYGTNSEKSDHDFIVVAKDTCHDQDSLSSSWRNLNATIYSQSSFQEKLNLHKISALECFFLPKDKILRSSIVFPFKVQKSILRSSISEKASHSWVKASKKFIVEKDKDIYIGKKSLFHSLRIIDFGTQIAKEGAIINYASSNEIWEEIITNPSVNWEDYKNQYHDLFNAKMTEFRKVAPK